MADRPNTLNLFLAIVVIAVVVWVIWLFFQKPHEGYADQVIHGGVGGIAGPIQDYDYYPYYQEMYDDSSYRV